MKLLKYVAASFVAASCANAAVTLGFSTTTNIAEGFANSSGSKNGTFAWGIIVDVDGDGFDGFSSLTSTAVDGGSLLSGQTTYDPGFVRTGTSGTGALPNGQVLTIGGIASDDRIFFSSNLMAVVGGEARATQLQSMNYGAGMAAGDKYGIVWFNSTTLGGAAVTNSETFGFWTKDGVSPTTGTVLPADPGSYTTAANGPSALFGADNTAGLKTAGITFVPEPSVALLGALGIFGLVRRRR
jgi:hypothetical protein